MIQDIHGYAEYIKQLEDLTMKTSRRTFLKALALAPVAAVAAPGLTLASPHSKDTPGLAPAGPRSIRGARRSAKTNFGALTDEQKELWSKALWKEAQKQSLFSRFVL